MFHALHFFQALWNTFPSFFVLLFFVRFYFSSKFLFNMIFAARYGLVVGVRVRFPNGYLNTAEMCTPYKQKYKLRKYTASIKRIRCIFSYDLFSAIAAIFSIEKVIVGCYIKCAPIPLTHLIPPPFSLVPPLLYVSNERRRKKTRSKKMRKVNT